MSLPNRIRSTSPAQVAMALCAAWCACAHGQTIADYSRAQRELIEATISQASARSAALAASAPSAAASSAPSPSSPPTVARGAAPAQPAGANVSVNGVFASPSRTVAEVVVDGFVWLLAVGQPVPGTPWRVQVVAADRVVLARREAAGLVATAESASRVFALPAPR